MSYINENTNIGRAYDWIKYKLHSLRWKITVIKNRTLRYLDDCKKIKKIWYAPIQVSYLEDACNFYAGHINQLENTLATKDNEIDLLLEEIIALKEYHEKVDERTATRKAIANYVNYRFDHGEDDDYEYSRFLNKLPNKYLTKRENEDWFDIEHDKYVLRDPIADMDYLDHAKYSLNQLEKRGLYEKKKY